MNPEPLKGIALDWIKRNRGPLIGISDSIWRHPELGLREAKTSGLLADELVSHGFRIEREVAGMATAFTASWGTGKPVIGILGELDALAGLSQKAVPRQDPVREGEPGHGCGHNLHAAGGLGGALALKTALETANIPGTVRFFACPAEETMDGKVWMVRDGCFDSVDAVLSHHPFTVNTASLRSSNAMNSVRFHFHGKSSHAAASPEMGISALDAVELMNTAVNYLREHVPQKVRIHYIIEEGGGQPNVVPAYARSWYFIRAPEREQVEQVYQRIMRIADGADLMTGTTHETEFLTGCCNKLPNAVLSKLVTDNMRRIGPPGHSEEERLFAAQLAETIPFESKRRSLLDNARPGGETLLEALFDERVLDAWDDGETGSGSTDVADVSWVTPTMEFSSACCILGTTAHSWQFVAQTGMSFGHKSLLFAAGVIACSAIELFTNEALLERARQEWIKRLAGRKYVSPLPPDHKIPPG